MDANGAGGRDIGKELVIKKKLHKQTKNNKTSNNSRENRML